MIFIENRKLKILEMLLNSLSEQAKLLNDKTGLLLNEYFPFPVLFHERNRAILVNDMFFWIQLNSVAFRRKTSEAWNVIFFANLDYVP